MVWITCMYEGREVGRFEVGKTWLLTHIRQEVCITMGNTAPEEFKLWIQRVGQVDVKVSSRESNPVSKESLILVFRRQCSQYCWYFIIDDPVAYMLQINRRKEKVLEAGSVMYPACLNVVPC
jgi:hypothetical protein